MTVRQNMIDHSPLAMATTEGPEHCLRSVNSAFCSLLGKQASEIIGRPISEAISVVGADSILALLDRVYGGENNGSVTSSQGLGSNLNHQSYTAWSLPSGNDLPAGLVILVVEKTLADKLLERANTEIIALNNDMRELNEQLVVSALEQHTLSNRNRGIAEALQYSILWPQQEKSFGALKVAVFYEPAMDDALIGGDLFDAFTLHNNSVMLIVGDVTGKGLKAAARTVEIRFALRAFAQDYKNPADTVSRLNEFICDFHYDDDLGGALVVLSLIVVDPITGEAKAASAGAEPPLVLRASGAVEEISVEGLILGIDRDALYKTTEFSLDAGDTLMMTTDGLTETRNGMDFFGSQRLFEAARKPNESRMLPEMGKAVLDAARAHGGGQFTDDVCLLLARRSY